MKRRSSPRRGAPNKRVRVNDDDERDAAPLPPPTPPPPPPPPPSPPPSAAALDAAALGIFATAPRRAAWASAQHGAVIRSLCIRTLALAAVGRLTSSAAPALRVAARKLPATLFLTILRFAVPHCAPSRAEREAACTACEEGGDITSLAAFLTRGGLDPSSRDVDDIVFDGGAAAPLLYIAAHDGHAAAVALLLDAGADVDAATRSDGATALYTSARNGHAEVVRLLLAARANVSKSRLTDGTTALYVASEQNHAEIVCSLLAAGADVDAARPDTGTTPLTIAAQQDNGDVVAALLAAGADVEKATKIVFATPLLVAAQGGHLGIVRQLLQRNAFVDAARADNGFTPLLIAAEEGHVGVVAALLAAGANKLQRECSPRTAAAATVVRTSCTSTAATLGGADAVPRTVGAAPGALSPPASLPIVTLGYCARDLALQRNHLDVVRYLDTVPDPNQVYHSKCGYPIVSAWSVTRTSRRVSGGRLLAGNGEATGCVKLFICAMTLYSF